MIVGRILGWLLLVLAIVAEGHDLWGWADTGRYQVTVLGQLWFQLDRGSLNLVQAVIQRYVSVFLWDPVIATVLLWPGALTLAVGGFLLVWLFRRRDRSHRRRRR